MTRKLNNRPKVPIIMTWISMKSAIILSSNRVIPRTRHISSQSIFLLVVFRQEAAGKWVVIKRWKLSNAQIQKVQAYFGHIAPPP